MANLEGADLRGANLTAAVVDGANFCNANLTAACLDETGLEDADHDGANLCHLRTPLANTANGESHRWVSWGAH